ncbi:MAG: coproporphyrinogen dehydrogenase HemZ [Eubacteriales bacterium]|nr:coproporphyrinogen dehydrogenase HemZ [Eubacteriales bacterium]
MVTLHLSGQQDRYGAADLLRLFFGGPVEEQDDRLVCAGPDLEISCSIDPDEDLFRVRTRLGAWTLSGQVMSRKARRESKRQLYQLLARATGRQFPWGSLTGIRPTLIAAECLAESQDREKALRLLVDDWFVSPEKADLALETALSERQVLEQVPPDSLLVYIGIPFCPTRCSYCSFITREAPSRPTLLEPYVTALTDEIRGFFSQIRQPVDALYIGGGTPTTLSAGQLARLFDAVRAFVPLAAGAEITVEAGRPDTIDAARLEVLRHSGVNRLCINPQTFHDQTLVRIGRRHNVAQMTAAWQLAREMGFDHLNLDLIAGLPGETPPDLADSLDQALALRPDSLTLHALAIKRSSALHEEQVRTGASEADLQPDWGEAVSAARRTLAAAGLAPYYLYRQKQTIGSLENTGFALPGKACRYNVAMISDQRSVIGLGSGAMSKIVCGNRVVRIPSPRSLDIYLERAGVLAAQKAAALLAVTTGATLSL